MTNETLKALLMIALFCALESAMGFQNIRRFRRALRPVPVRNKRRKG
jgi:hypothetical protein